MMARQLPFAFTWAWIVLFAGLVAGAAAKELEDGDGEAAELSTVSIKTAGMEKRSGLLETYIDLRLGKLWLELPPPQKSDGEVARLIYYEGLRRGLGSNPVGLDRGQLGEGRLLIVRRIGPRVLFEQPNLRYRASSDRLSELRATAESFASSVIWGGEIGALDPSGRALVDLTSFLVRDAHNVIRTLADTDQGTFQLDPDRSAIDFSNCPAFPDNLEFEAILTFAGEDPGQHVRGTAPIPESVTLVMHQSLIRLPPEGYQPRAYDPRAGSFFIEYQDYAVPLSEPIQRRKIVRHRLEKVDPKAARSKVKKPLVYYVDPGAPEPVRSALIAGASWWAEAFNKAGLIDAFRVEVLPDGAHPLDVRYNVIQWVHRSTRGWSYGGGISDPRTGEMLKGHVSLGSLRVRQDRLLFEGLLGAGKTGSGEADDPIEIALARIRQLAAHEVGHALGMNHNFAASTYGRASVMDYPAPLITLDENNEFDFSQAYATGIGEWDIQAIRYSYSQSLPGVDESAALEAILRENRERGLLYLADEDTRSVFASEPRTNVWDNGADPAAGLELALEIRRLALDRFGEHNLAQGRPLAELEAVLAPVYFHHRYMLDAAVKAIGGMEYNYAVRGDGQWATRPVDTESQQRALKVILGLLEPSELDIPDSILTLLAPAPNEAERDNELFVGAATRPTFDALGAAATAAGQVVEVLLEPHRLARLVEFHRRDTSLPTAEEVIEKLLDRAFIARELSPREAAIQRVVQRVVVEGVIGVARFEGLAPRVRARLEYGLRQTLGRVAEQPRGDVASEAHLALLKADIERFLERREPSTPTEWNTAPMPPGSPIGNGMGESGSLGWRRSTGDRHGCGVGSRSGGPFW